MTRIPESPPDYDEFLSGLVASGDTEALVDAVQKVQSPRVGPIDAKGRYLHWEKLKHLPPPEGYTTQLYWYAMQASRRAIARRLPLLQKNENGPLSLEASNEGLRNASADNFRDTFWFCMPDPLLARVMWISEQASGALVGEPTLTDEKARQRHIINSLIDEAIYSSQLEGASTTRPEAREMIRTARKPTDVSEQMILNNYRAMLFIRDHIAEGDDITPAMVFALHKILVEGTDIPGDRVGEFRRAEDDIVVADNITGNPLHIPPPVDELRWRLAGLCSFINGDVEAVDSSGVAGQFMPPVVKAIVAHFMLGYDHPFYDGNGRTARALFYWVMAREGFWLMEHISISGEIKKKRQMPGYIKAYLHTETDGGDVTYFILHQLDMITRAIETLKARLRSYAVELHETEAVLAGSKLSGRLNYRQLALLHHALKNPGAVYTVKSHQTSHRVATQTARTDLKELADTYGLLNTGVEKRAATFMAPADLLQRIKALA